MTDYLKVAKEFESWWDKNYTSNQTVAAGNAWKAACEYKDKIFTRICADKDAEIAGLREEVRTMLAVSNAQHDKIQAAQDLIAMQAEALNTLRINSPVSMMLQTIKSDSQNEFYTTDRYRSDKSRTDFMCAIDSLKAISDTAETVAAWEEAKLRTLQQQVAMQQHLLDSVYAYADEHNKIRIYKLRYHHTKATAEAYEKEVAAKLWRQIEERLGDMYGRHSELFTYMRTFIAQFRAESEKA